MVMQYSFVKHFEILDWKAPQECQVLCGQGGYLNLVPKGQESLGSFLLKVSCKYYNQTACSVDYETVTRLIKPQFINGYQQGKCHNNKCQILQGVLFDDNLDNLGGGADWETFPKASVQLTYSNIHQQKNVFHME